MLNSKIKEFVRRLRTSDLIYFEEQFMYGHREILLHYCLQKNLNLGKDYILEGSIDHGFAYQENIWKLRKRNLTRANRYVWNDRQHRGHGLNSATLATGSPWLYLLGELGLNPANIKTKLKKDPNKVVIFPGHNIDTYHKYAIEETIENYLSIIPSGSKVTVCLFWTDFCDPILRRYFSDLGWTVESMGYVPRLPLPDSTIGGRQNFLLELFNLFSDASLILTDNASTGLFYALSLNVSARYIPSQQLIEFESIVNKSVGLSGKRPEGFFNSEMLWVESHFPQLIETKNEPNKFLEFAWEELGYKNFLENESGIKFKWINGNSNVQALDLYSERLSSIKMLL